MEMGEEFKCYRPVPKHPGKVVGSYGPIIDGVARASPWLWYPHDAECGKDSFDRPGGSSADRWSIGFQPCQQNSDGALSARQRPQVVGSHLETLVAKGCQQCVHPGFGAWEDGAKGRGYLCSHGFVRVCERLDQGR